MYLLLLVELGCTYSSLVLVSVLLWRGGSSMNHQPDAREDPFHLSSGRRIVGRQHVRPRWRGAGDVSCLLLLLDDGSTTRPTTSIPCAAGLCCEEQDMIQRFYIIQTLPRLQQRRR